MSTSPSLRLVIDGPMGWYREPMDAFFSILAIVVALASLPCGYLVARRCTKSVGLRVFLTIVFGIVILIAGLIAVMMGCGALGGRMDMR